MNNDKPQSMQGSRPAPRVVLSTPPTPAEAPHPRLGIDPVAPLGDPADILSRVYTRMVDARITLAAAIADSYELAAVDGAGIAVELHRAAAILERLAPTVAQRLATAYREAR